MKASNLDNLLELRNACIFFWRLRFFKSDKVVQIRYGNIVFYAGYVAIKVDRSIEARPIDQLRKGNEVVISLYFFPKETCGAFSKKIT